MNASTQLRLLVAEASRTRDLDVAATERLARSVNASRSRPSARSIARRIGLALIRLGESLAEPAPGPVRAR